MPRPRSDPSLRRWYLKWNRKFFDERLPTSVVLFWEAVTAGIAEFDPYDAHKVLDDFGQCSMAGGNDYFIVRIDPCLRAKRSQWGMALFHEMVHVELHPYGGHGRKFQEAMLRLAQIGAFKNLW